MAAFSSGTITGATALHHYAGLNSVNTREPGDDAALETAVQFLSSGLHAIGASQTSDRRA